MKKSLIMMAMVAMVFASCKKEQAPAPATDPMDNGPVPVKFTVGQPSIQVKSTGAVGGVTEAENVWSGETVFIYGFENNYDSGTKRYLATPNLGVPAMINGNLNVVTSDPNTNVAELSPKQEDGAEIEGASVAGEPYYYQSTKVYSFYGYHVDDAWVTNDPATVKPAIDATGVVVPIEINGGQDIMIAKADPATDIDAREGTDLKYVPVDRAYSAYSARRGVIPNLSFQHLLTRFTFKVVAGAQSAYNIEIQGLTVKSKSTADLVVVSADETGNPRGLTNIANEVEFSLMQRTSNSDRTLIPLEPVKFENGPFDPSNKETKPLGESMMVMPGEASYDLVLSTKLIAPLNNGVAPNTPTEDYETTIDYAKVQHSGTAAADGKFEAGKSYEITLVVYGPEQVEIIATLQSWKDGGDYTYDPDEDEVKPEAGA